MEATERRQKVITTNIESFAFDKDTGQFTDTIKQLTQVEKSVEVEPSFVKLYLDDIARLKELPKSCSGILYEMLRLMTYDNEIVLNVFARRRIAERLNTTEGYIYKTINHFISCGLITRLGASTYLVNPYIFGKGKWADVKKIRVTIDYDQSGKIITMERK